jgi:DNA repair protein RecO (recombination protein O)
MEYKYTAIVLGKKDIKETDRIYSFYTLEQGKISAIARGVRKTQSKLAGHLENYYLIDLTIMKNRGMGNIASAVVENNFKKLKSDFGALEKVFQAIKIFNHLINDQQRDTEVFLLFLDYLDSLDKLSSHHGEIKKNLITQGFIFKFLNILGYKIEIGKCVECKGRLSESRNFFDYNRGGVICNKCFGCSSNSLPISREVIKIIRIFFHNNLNSLVKLKIGEIESGELRCISQTFIKWIC